MTNAEVLPPHKRMKPLAPNSRHRPKLADFLLYLNARLMEPMTEWDKMMLEGIRSTFRVEHARRQRMLAKRRKKVDIPPQPG